MTAKSRPLTLTETKYRDEVVPAMMKKFKYTNPMQVPKLVKCVVNMGVGKATEDIKVLEDASAELAAITGQKPVFTRAKKSISNFKIRKGQAIGCRVTLRRRHMFEFIDRLLNVALPRIRDFRGVNSRAFDDAGNYNLGVREQNIFPEVISDRIARPQGMDIAIVTTSKTKEEGLYFLYYMGVPFRDRDERLILN